jgi:hypothetical protein
VGRGWGGDFLKVRSARQNSAREVSPTGVVSVRRAARGLCLWKGRMNGGAARARPEYRRMISASDRRRLAAHGAGLSTCPSSGPSARIAPAAIWTNRGCGFRGSGTDPDAPHWPVMSATGPFRCAAPPAFRQVWSAFPARWLALHGQFWPPASGTPMASASLRDPPHVTTDPERPSSRLVRYVRDPSGSGSTESVARGWKVGKKMGRDLG